MLPRTGAQLGTSIRWASSDIALTPTARPKIAMPIGSAVAMSDPKARNRMTAAASRPMNSPTLTAGLLEREEQVAAHLDPQRRVGLALGGERP